MKPNITKPSLTYLKDPLNLFLIFTLLSTVTIFLLIFLPITRSAVTDKNFMVHNVIETSAYPIPPIESRHARKTTSTAVIKTRTTSNVSNIKELFPLLTALVFLMGFECTLLQMRWASVQSFQTNLWKKKEFALEQLIAFSQDRSVKNVKKLIEAIDSPYGTIVVLEVPNSQTGILELQEIKVDKQLLLNAFTPAPGPYTNITTKEKIEIDVNDPEHSKSMRIAWEIDQFFFYLVGLRTFVNSNVLECKDIEPFLHYWLGLIISPRGGKGDPNWSGNEKEIQTRLRAKASLIRSRLHDYIREYFNGPPGRSQEGEAFFICQILGINEQETPFKQRVEKK